METVVLSLFCGLLLGCIVLKISVLYALVAGLVLFLLYGRYKGVPWSELMKMSVSGVKTVKNILMIFLLIGMLTALWRAAGTIPVIICYAAQLVRPSIFILMAFLLNCLVSVLTGTAFGTAATMGVICMTMASAMQMNPLFVGGAILSGVFFGDRCSPVSTSVLLVGALTGTDIFENIKWMCRTALVPFLATCAIYAALGMSSGQAAGGIDVEALFSREFQLHWVTLLPAVLILLLSLFRVRVQKAMLCSILLSLVICLTLQNVAPAQLIELMITGYRSADPGVAAMLNGGGIVSMVRVAAIVFISSSYAGIFEGTGLLVHAIDAVTKLGQKITPFGGIVCASIITGMVACNQTLSIMLTNQLCKDLVPDKTEFAIDLENSAVVIAPLVPWSIAGGTPLASIGAPFSCLVFACFLYLVPIWHLAASIYAAKARPHNK